MKPEMLSQGQVEDGLMSVLWSNTRAANFEIFLKKNTRTIFWENLYKYFPMARKKQHFI